MNRIHEGLLSLCSVRTQKVISDYKNEYAEIERLKTAPPSIPEAFLACLPISNLKALVILLVAKSAIHFFASLI